MEDADLRLLIRSLAYYLHRCYALEAFEPPLRGRKTGPANEGRRSIGFVVRNPRALDAIRWELMKRELGRR
jgi:hypothetical protein